MIKIKNDNRSSVLKFKDLERGETFEYDKRFYIKTSNGLAIVLEGAISGVEIDLDKNTTVKKVDLVAEVV